MRNENIHPNGYSVMYLSQRGRIPNTARFISTKSVNYSGISMYKKGHQFRRPLRFVIRVITLNTRMFNLHYPTRWETMARQHLSFRNYFKEIVIGRVAAQVSGIASVGTTSFELARNTTRELETLRLVTIDNIASIDK